jgi:hypothetical protein
MKFLVKYCFLLIFSTNKFSAQTQLLTLINQGATIRTMPGSTVRVSGSVLNNSNGKVFINANSSTDVSKWYVSQNLTNHSQASTTNQTTITCDGHIYLKGDWINNGTFSYTTSPSNFNSSTVFLEGASQLLSGSTATVFYNLTLQGIGVKKQTINKSCANILALNNLELNTDVYTFFVLNPAVGAITRNPAQIQSVEGFVSSAIGGYLSRATNSIATYLFPTGSTANNSANTPGTGSTRYRPVEIIPTSTSASSYTVRMANLDASTTTENSGLGYNRSNKENTICTTNSFFFHQINRSSGTADADIKVYYIPSSDGDWQGLARWNLPAIDNTWRIISGSSTTASTSPFSVATKTAWNNFSANPYILYNGLSVIANCGGPVCPGVTIPAHSLSSTVTPASPPSGSYSYSWLPTTGLSNSNVANPTLSPTPSLTTTYTVTVSNTANNCQASNSCTLTVNQPPSINAISPP